MPHFYMVPGRKFSISTSAHAISRRAIACPSGSRRFKVTERLLRPITGHQGEWP